MIVVPQPMPDEIARSILGRMLRWNGLRRCKGIEAVRALREATGISASEAGPTVVLIAQILGRDPRGFVEQHTLLPWWLIVRPKNWLDEDGRLRDSSLAQTIQPQRPYVSLCPKCVSEDLQFHGHSYWRRAHQLDGAYECLKHGVGLRHYADVDTVQTYPSEALDYAPLKVSGTLRAAERRFQRLITDLGENQISIPGTIAFARLKRLLTAQGEGPFGPKQLVTIQETLEETFSQEWMRETTPGFCRGRSEAPSPGLTGFFRRARLDRITHAFAFAVALLKRDEDAFELFATPPSDIEIKASELRRASPERAGPGLGSQALTQTYIAHKGRHAGFLPQKEVQRALCQARLIQMGLPDLDEQLLEAVRLFYGEALSISESIQRSGAELGRFEVVLRTAGESLRQASENIQNVAIEARRPSPHHGVGGESAVSECKSAAGVTEGSRTSPRSRRLSASGPRSAASLQDRRS